MSYQDDVLNELRTMNRTLAQIALNTAKPASKRRPAKNPHAQAIAEAREKAADQTPINRTLVLWVEICPANPQPAGLNLERRAAIREAWDAMNGEEGIRALFEAVAANDWLSGRPCGEGRNVRTRRNPVHLFEALAHRLEIAEGVYS